MQKPPMRNVKAAAKSTSPSSVQPAEEIVHFTLADLLPAGHMLALNTPLGTLSQLSCTADGPRLSIEQQFTHSEVCILKPLLESYPHFCPYEILLASFNSTDVTESAIEQCRRRLHEALRLGTWDQEMRPVRNVLSRARLKLNSFGLDIVSMLETGYILMPKSKYRSAEA